MTKKSFYFKTFIALIFFFSFIKIGYSQLDYKRSYELSLTNLPLQDFTFIFTQRINDFKYLEITNSFVIHKAKEYDNGEILMFGFKDPFKLYDLYRLRIGLRFLKANNYYTSPSLIFNVGGFRNGTILKYKDDYGSDYYDVDYILNRLRFDIGAILKFGHIKTYDNNILRDIYWGFGFKVKFYNDAIIAERHWGSGSFRYYDPPQKDQYIKIAPTLHFGILFGFKKQ
jgi:hypothetical protein